MSPGDVQVIALVYDFLRSGAPGGNTLRPGDFRTMSDRLATACEVESASPEVERARDATHRAIALNRAPAGGRT